MPELIHVPQPSLQQLETLLREGKAYSAWQLARTFGDLKQWAPGQSRRVAAWIASRTGADRLARALDWLNWRADRQNPEWYFHALFSRIQWKAPALLIPEIRAKITEFSARMDTKTHSDLLAFLGWALGTLRDFPAAHESIHQALTLTPERAWAHTQYSNLLEMEDRYEEAMEAALAGLKFGHFQLAIVSQTVDCLVHLGRDKQAIELLHQAHEQTEQGDLTLRLQALYSEQENHEKGLWALSEAERLMPMLSEKSRKWMAGRRADFLYQAGDLDGFLEWCDKKGEGFQEKVAQNLRRPGARERKRVRLNVPFIRQHNMTCAPATLASLAKFWGHSHEHLAIADAICYDGTPWHKERIWAEENGYIAREFRLTREILIALINRGIPFTLTTSSVTNAHMQACIGYDDRLDTLLLRDPTHRHYGEMLIDLLIDEHPIQGPRCMLLLPTGEIARLEGLILPDEFLYEAYHKLSVAIVNHDRWKAEEAVSTMRAISSDHPLTWSAQGELAGYLGHRVKQLEIIDRLLARFPDHQPLHLIKLGVLQQTADREAKLELLRSAVEKKTADPVFVSEFGELLLEDARQLPLAGHFLRRAVRLQRSSGRPLESLARWHDKSGNFSEAARLRRHAASLSISWEGYSRAYFDSCRAIGKTTEALDFLKARVADLGRTKGDPWLTYAHGLDIARQSQEARTILEQAVATFPNDGSLRLQAGRMMMAWGEADRALGLTWIEEARGKVSETVWLRNRASAAIYVGDRTSAIRLWKSVLLHEPLAMDAYQTLPQLIAEERGEADAIALLEEAVRSHPRQPFLWRQLAQWKTNPQEILQALDQALILDPDDNWARRERAHQRFNTGDPTGSLADARETVERDANSAESHGTLAAVLHRNGQQAEALEHVRKALRLNVDYLYAITQLMAWTQADGVDAQKMALGEIESEMQRQVSNGDCLSEYQQHASQILPPPGLLAKLQGFCRERPDLWQTWSARITQSLRMDLLAEAGACAAHLRTTFPLLPRTWIEDAKVCHARGDFAAEVKSLQKAVDLSPAWDWAARELAQALERINRFDEAEEVLLQAIRHSPLNATNYAYLANLYLKRNKLEEAYTQLSIAVAKAPFYTWGWTTMGHLSQKLGRFDSFLELVRANSETHRQAIRWWETVTEIYQSLDRVDDMLESARTGLKIDPANSELLDLRAVALCQKGLFDEALQACEPPTTREIAGRHAWILMESGDAPAAIREMKDLLAREPNYTWGWHQLSTWQGRRKDWQGLAESAKQWARLAPDLAIAHGHVALAAEEMDQPELAKRAFERAFLLDPTYHYAGRSLFRLQVEAGELSAAQTTLTTLRHYVADVWIECDAVSLALKQQNDSLALELASKLCRETDQSDALIWLNQEFTRRHVGGRWLQQLEQIIREGTASPALLAAWANLASNQDTPATAAKQLRKFKIDEKSRNAAWAALLRTIPKAPDQPLLETWVRQERPRFTEDLELWNIVGEIWLEAGKHKEAVKWLADWKNRPNAVGAHTLVNLSAALDALKGPASAVEIRETGILQFRGNSNALYLRAGQASYLAGRGEIEAADKLLSSVEDSSLSDYYQGLSSLARSVIAAHHGDEKATNRHYRIALEKFGRWPNDRAVRSHFIPIQKTLAKLLPWASNKPRKIAEKWDTLPKTQSNWARFWPAIIYSIIVIGCVILIATGSVNTSLIGVILIARLIVSKLTR